MTSHNVVSMPTTGVAYEIVPAAQSNGFDVTIQNNNTSATILLGDNTVTTSNYGFKVAAGAAISFELAPGDSIWAVSPSSDVTVHVLRVDLEGTHIV